MYHVKPYYATNDTSGLDANNVMYSMRPLYQSSAGEGVTPSTGPDVTKLDLFSRQEALISNIEQQIQRVDGILTEAKVSIHHSARCSSQGPPNATTSAPFSAQSVSKVNVSWPDTIRYPLDIVVQADPTRLPVSPWALRKLLGDSVMIRTHVHSSYQGALPPVENDNGNTGRTNSNVKIIFTVIFRNTKEMTFMIDPVNQTAVSGEANLFRYICRVFPIFPALGVFEETLSDHYVDVICTGLIGAKSKVQQSTLKLLIEQIAKKDGRLICDTLTPADFCLHAALQKSPSLTLPANVQKWQNSVMSAF